MPYRYTLERGPWLNGSGTVLFVMLNPSTADEVEDDPTIRRCIGLGQTWGYAGLLVGNLYALRATDPRDLFASDDPVGPENDATLALLALRATEVIVAWGSTPHPFPHRAGEVLRLLERYVGGISCLGRTKELHPRHPLYVKRDVPRTSFQRLSAV